jgi:predicted Fe-S protein YdhL (DUF1289 family)
VTKPIHVRDLDRLGLRVIDGRLVGTKRGKPENDNDRPQKLRQRDYERLARFKLISATFFLPGVRLVSEANQHEPWQKRMLRKEAQQIAVHAAVMHDNFRPVLPVDVVITRHAPRFIVDDDNERGCAKHVRDEIARWLGCDDGNRSLVTFDVRQVTGPYAVEFEVRKRGGI